MTRMLSIFSLAAVTVLLIPLSNCNKPPYPELNPALGKYQNAPECLPIRETWYSVYRNYVYDPEFGGAVKCGRLTSLGPEQNGSFPMLLEYGHTSIEILSTPVAYEGYDVKNLQYYQAAGQTSSLLVYIGYVDCQKCVLFRNSYINEKACTLLVPESALGNHGTCCDFIFDLLCGTGPKYYTYDQNCPK